MVGALVQPRCGDEAHDTPRPFLCSQVETSAGRFEFGIVDRQRDLASRHDLKLYLLWFGGNRGVSACYWNLTCGDGSSEFTSQVPVDVLIDRARYRRAVRPDGPASHAI